jgi:hypothetical protein
LVKLANRKRNRRQSQGECSLFMRRNSVFCGAVLLRVKLKDDKALRLHGSSVDEGGLVAPFVESCCDGGDQIWGPQDRVHARDVAVLGDGGFDADGSVGAGSDLRGLGIDARDQLADDDFFVAMKRPAAVRGGHVHGTLDVHGDSGRFEDAFAGQAEKGSLVTGREMDLERLSGWRVHLNDGRHG